MKTLKISAMVIALSGVTLAAHAETVTVGGANFSEQSVLANIYVSALEQKGITVKTRLNLGNREIIIPALKAGELDIVPEYAGALLNYYNTASTATSLEDVSRELKQVLPAEFKLLSASEANSTTAWAVRQETAEKYHLKTLSDLARVSSQLTVGGPPEFSTRALGLPGLERVYGMKFKSVKSLDMGGPLSRMALNSGRIDVATIVSTQGDISQEKWVVLVDDKHEQPAQNVIPLIRSGSVSAQAQLVLNSVSSKLTTSDLIQLNRQVDVEHKDPAKVAGEWVRLKLSAR